MAKAAVSLKTANLKLRDQPKHAPNRTRLGVLSERALRGASAGVRWVRAPFLSDDLAAARKQLKEHENK